MNPFFLVGAQATKHAIGRFVSVICVGLVCLGLWWAVNRAFIHPPKTENYSQLVQAGGTNYNIEIYNPEDTFFLGVKFWGLKLGISKPTVKKIKDITEEAKLKK
jgi:hypothetical protein